MAREAIFISYRRDDSATEAAELYQAIAARIGESHLYKDVDNIPIGADFGAHIRGILPRCQIALIVIGPKWVKAKDQRGRRRLEDPYDWVRVEVELALATADLRVVPVLVNGANMPRANEVPSSLHQLLGRNAAIVRRGSELKTDTDRLLNALALVAAPEMVRIPAGEFMMGELGADLRDHEGPQHRVHIKAFELGKYPVTFGEWDAAIAAGATLYRPDDAGWGRDRRPVINVTWQDTQAYLAWLNGKTAGGYRLPSEAEWEYACRAQTVTPWSTGESLSASQARIFSNSTAPVGSYPPNAFGLHDMHGNVWEWCEDFWHENYDGAPNDGSAWLTDTPEMFGGYRLLRGASWQAYHLDDVRSSVRLRCSSADRGHHYGFRVARTIL